ncbi:MAG: hypothetical protein JW878_05925 [Methanomicrobia archaeon]|nr:hypothetical protein [Methanomicrobia archaeon]
MCDENLKKEEEVNVEGLINKCFFNLLIGCNVVPTNEKYTGFADTFLGSENGVYRIYPSVMHFLDYIRRYRGKHHGIFSGNVPRNLNLINSLIDLPPFYTVKGERNKLKHLLRHISMDKFRLACFVAFATLEQIIVKYIIFLDDTLIDTDGLVKKNITVNKRPIKGGKPLVGLNNKIDLLIETDKSGLSKKLQFLKDKKVFKRIVTIHRNALMHTGRVLDWEIYNILLLIYLLFLHDPSAPFNDYVTEED